MLLLLEPDAAQQNALHELLEAQQDPASPEYHRWLSPEDFGQRFGASERDVKRIVDWLAGHGFEVEPVESARRQSFSAARPRRFKRPFIPKFTCT